MIGKLLEFTRTTIRGIAASIAKVDLGGGHTSECQHFSPAGDDSQPLAEDYAIAVPIANSGQYAIAGYVDVNNAQSAEPGGKRIYARGSDGAQVAELWLKNTGEIVASNAIGNVSVSPAGDIDISNNIASFTLSAAGAISVSNAGGSFTIDPAGLAAMTVVSLTLTGNLITVGTMLNNGKDVGNTHGHTQGNDGAGDTEQPIVGVT